MGRKPCCSRDGLRRGAWTQEEDKILSSYIKAHGEGRWRSLPSRAGLKRCGKSCRLRWLNYLRPDIKRGNISQEEDDLIIRLHKLLGNRWSLIAGRLPGRTDNEIKNYWNTHLSKTIIRQGNGQEQQNQNQKYQMEYLKTEKPVPILIETSNVVVRTKARRCTGNVFITPSQEEEPCENAETNKGGSETAQYAEVADHMDSMKAPDQFINADHEIESWWDALMDFNVNVNDCNWMDESPPVHNAAEGGEHDQVVMLESEMDETRNPPVFDLDLNDLSAFLNWEGGEL
ncbi:hypothetical protein J5N97_000156 [Dioscorea zingiberensis]|uniref:Uncharacterized protein n=1 Tax=Dioscorea zingiberensis TaxID=325984 RepID=A0A9D5BSW7_9LILI|nr:hypothetical protein J5N97_000156 [Dioscorea zingiberensis]